MTSPATATITIETIETAGLGDRSYVVHDGRTALVVDPQRDLDRVEAILDEAGVVLTHVLETHLHNDYVSGGPVLARAHDAAYVGHADDELFLDRHGVRDGDTLTVGAMTVRVLGTPGHTPTHLAYVVDDGSRDVAVFTGGSMLYGSVGRTDLVSRRLTEQLTRDQHATVRRLVDELDDDVEVRPTHGFGSFCSSISPDDDADGTGSDGLSTIGEQREANVALQHDVDDFVEQLLAGLDAYPRYYVHMAPRNRLGAEPIDLSPPVEADPTELRARIHAGEWVVDLRRRTAFATDHVRGTINVELAGSFVTYLGWLVPWTLPVTLVGDTPDQVADAQRQLARIGIDRPAAGATGGPDAYGAGLDRGAYRVVDFTDLAAAQADGDGPLVLDTRRSLEWAEGHVAGALHVPLHELPRRIDDVPADREVWVHCASGYRSSIAASLLARARRDVVLIDDHVGRARKAGVAWSDG